MELADNSVVSGKVADNAIVSGKLAPESVAPNNFAIQPVARVTRTTNQPKQGLVGFLPVSWTTEIFDTKTMHDNSTNNTRLTAPVAGIYDVKASINWAAHVDTGVRGLLLVKNGTTGIAVKAGNPNNSAGTYAQEVSGTVSMAAGDYVEVRAQQISDFSDPVGPPPSFLNPLNIVSDPNVTPYFSLSYMAPAE